MNFFRAKIRIGGGMALFAIFLQMVLSFAHVHADELGLPPGHGSHALAAHFYQTIQPANQDHRPADADYCPICASMAVLGTWFPVAAPSVPVHLALALQTLQARSDRELSPQTALSAQARAPPA